MAVEGRRVSEGVPKTFHAAINGEGGRKKFDAFREGQLNLSRPCYSSHDVQALLETCDAVVVGSDQVWRLPQERVYFMDFGAGFEGKKISYAACCGSVDDGRYGSVELLWKAMDAI